MLPRSHKTTPTSWRVSAIGTSMSPTSRLEAGAPRESWWDATNASALNFDMLMHSATAFTSDVHKRPVLWQVPAGNTVYDRDNNTRWHYQDNCAHYFLRNYPGDGHLAALASAGVIGILFSGGEPGPTDI